MNVNDLMDNLKEYYGEYINPAIEKMVKGYLFKEICHEKLKMAYQAILIYHSVNYGILDVASVRKAIWQFERDEKQEVFKRKARFETIVDDMSFSEEDEKHLAELMAEQGLSKSFKEAVKNRSK